MSIGSEKVDRVLDLYERTEIGSDMNAQGVLEGYLSSQGIAEYNVINSDFPFEATMGRMADSEGEIVLKSHFTYPEGSGFHKDHVNTTLGASEIDKILEKGVIEGKSNVLGVAGVELVEDKKTTTLEDEDELRLDTAHCIVFYGDPVLGTKEDTDYEGDIHRVCTEQAVSEPSLATAIVNTGHKPSGVDFTVARVDYWTRTFDGIEDGGIDYTELDWENISEL